MFIRFVLAMFLVAHGLVHLLFLSPQPPATDGGPPWPFDLDGSWVLRPMGVAPRRARRLAIALIAVTITGYTVAAVVALGLPPEPLWVPAVVVGSVASIASLTVFFRPQLVIGLGIDVALLWLALVSGWAPSDPPLLWTGGLTGP